LEYGATKDNSLIEFLNRIIDSKNQLIKTGQLSEYNDFRE